MILKGLGQSVLSNLLEDAHKRRHEVAVWLGVLPDELLQRTQRSGHD